MDDEEYAPVFVIRAMAFGTTAFVLNLVIQQIGVNYQSYDDHLNTFHIPNENTEHEQPIKLV